MKINLMIYIQYLIILQIFMNFYLTTYKYLQSIFLLIYLFK